MNKIKLISIKIILSIVLLTSLATPSFAQVQGDVDTDCADIKNNLRIRMSDGVSDGEVTKLQKYLFENKFLSISPSGFFGSKTKQAVTDYQKSVNLIGTGFVGPLTRVEIKKDSCDSNISDSLSIASSTVTLDGAYFKVERTNKSGKAGEVTSVKISSNFKGASPKFYYECSNSGFGSSSDYGNYSQRTFQPTDLTGVSGNYYIFNSNSFIKKEWIGPSSCIWYLKNSKGDIVTTAEDKFNFTDYSTVSPSDNSYFFNITRGNAGGKVGDITTLEVTTNNPKAAFVEFSCTGTGYAASGDYINAIPTQRVLSLTKVNQSILGYSPEYSIYSSQNLINQTWVGTSTCKWSLVTSSSNDSNRILDTKEETFSFVGDITSSVASAYIAQVGVGRVLDDSGKPVKGAEVSCGFLSGRNSLKDKMTTDANGLFYPKLTKCLSTDYIALSSCPRGYTPYGLVGGSGSSVAPINSNGNPINTNNSFTCKKDTELDKAVEITSNGNEGKIPFWVDIYCGGKKSSNNAGMRVVDTYGPEYVFPSNCMSGDGEMSLRATGIGSGYSAVQSEVFYRDRIKSNDSGKRDQIIFTINRN